MNFQFLQSMFEEQLQHSPITLLVRQCCGFNLGFLYASVCQGLSIHLSKGSVRPCCCLRSGSDRIIPEPSSVSVQGFYEPVPAGQYNSSSAGEICALNTTA